MKIFILFLSSLLTIMNAQTVQFIEDTVARNDIFNNRQYGVIDNSGFLHVVYSGSQGTNSATTEIYYAKESTSGFQTINVTNNAVTDNYPTISMDGNGKMHIGFTGRDAGNLFQIKYTNNISGNFTEPIWITTGGLNKATPFSKIGPDSVMHFVYFTYVTGTDYVYYRYYDLRTSTLSPEYQLTTAEAGGDFEAALDVDASGVVHLATRSGTSSLSGALKYYNNSTGTMTEYPTGVTAAISYAKLTIDKNGVPYILFRNESDLKLYLTNRTGNTFTTPVAITPNAQRPAGYQNFAFDDSNRVYIVYQSSQAASGRGFYLIHGKDYVFSDTILVYNLTSEYVTRNSSFVVAGGNGDVTVLYAPGGVRNTLVVCDIFRKRANLFGVVPVEFTSFSGQYIDGAVELRWSTGTERNNRGFEVEKFVPRGIKNEEPRNEDWESLGKVKGAGNSLTPNNYFFTDVYPTNGDNKYRIKQIDFDGSYTYSDIINVNAGMANDFVLHQNYPNPFNPSTIIKYSVPSAPLSLAGKGAGGEIDGEAVSLRVYDLLGREVATLVNEKQGAGNYEVEFKAGDLPSGIYIYRLTAGSANSTRKMQLVK
ncbi:MAG: T9SS type A sorting domain-containing protein [Ignavibacteriaceae bacterium]|nr:T9SS type A sorting domain-containing protein [Ignavibacteriaceae bacterium]